MTSKKMQAHCSITEYIAATDPELHAVLHGLCADRVLNSTRGKSGITFLVPKDKALRKKIIDLAYSDKPEDVNKASDMINALIMRDVMKDVGEWNKKKGTIANALVPPQLVDIDKASGEEVVFKSGAKATLDKGFIDASRKRNLAVWNLTAGEIPVTTDKAAPKVDKKKGSYQVDHSRTNMRFKIALAVENAYVLHRLQCDADPSTPHRDVYMEQVLSLLHHIQGDKQLLYESVVPLLTMSEIDFYMLVEPHREAGPWLIDDHYIAEWWALPQPRPQLTMAECQELLRGPAGAEALVYKDPKALLDAIAGARRALKPVVDSKPRQMVDVIERAYSELESKNSINGKGPVYPAKIAQMYAAEPGLKLLHDEMRYIAYMQFRCLEAESPFDGQKFHHLVNLIGEYGHAAPSERPQAMRLLNRNKIRFQISPDEPLTEITNFVWSTAFMHIPLTKEACQEVKNSRRDNAIPDLKSVWNLASDSYDRHSRTLGATNDAAALVKALCALDPNTLEPALMDALREKYAEHMKA